MTLSFVDDSRGNGMWPAISSTWGYVKFATMDINLDGYEDIIAFEGVFPPVAEAAFPMHIYVNNGSGLYTDQTATYISGSIPTSVFVNRVVIDDFNGDGRPDILAGDNGYDGGTFPGATNLLLLSNPNGTLSDASSNLPSQKTVSYTVAAGDIDGDGDVDIFDTAIGPSIGANIIGPMLLKNDGTGSFSDASVQLPDSINDRTELGGIQYLKNVFYIAELEDLNNDGAAELIVGPERNQGPLNGQAIVFWNNGSGTFSDTNRTILPASPFGTATEFSDIKVFDSNRDGHLDVLTVAHSGNLEGGWTLQLFHGNSAGSLSDATSAVFTQGSSSNNGSVGELKIVDFDLDGDFDIVGLPLGAFDPAARPVLWLNNGSGVYSQTLFWNAVANNSMPIQAILSPDGNGYNWMNFDKEAGTNKGIYSTWWATQDDTAPRTVNGDAGFDHFIGGKNADTLNGFGWSDILFGMGGSDVLNGGAGNDLMDGGTGADNMTGGNGNDTYVVDNAGDVITELAAEGFDTVNTTINYDMPAEVDVLNMLGTADLQTNGNSLANHINGNSGNNYINGAAGTDLMTGGGGNDTYAVDNSYDQVVELAGGGSDAVYSSVDLLLAGNVETLVLTESAVQGFGDATNNQIFGNGNVNVLFGQGGDDYLLGLGGDDIFVITPEAGAFDVIGDFQGAGVAGGDRIGVAGFGAGAAVYQVSQTSFEIRSADSSIIQQFVLQGHDGTALDAGDYYFA